MRFVFAALLLAPILAAAAVEEGELGAAKFRIHMPDPWNGSLVVYAHGYDEKPQFQGRGTPVPLFVGLGYAVAESAYSTGGWAVEQALPESEALREYFVKKHGRPKRTYAAGMSMGGHIAAALLERYPDKYDGGLPLCGILAPAYWFTSRRAFDLSVVADFYLPQTERLDTATLDGTPEAAAALRQWARVRTNAELAGLVNFIRAALVELRARAGGNPFDNRNTIYTGSPDDNALNDGVKRYRADPRAREYVLRNYPLAGRLRAPMLHLHTTDDNIVPPWAPNQYVSLTAQAGNPDLFVQRYVKRAGHCAFQPAEITDAMKTLAAWVEQGRRPE
jgi:pimeloyl-ACP methyl ester carboxylesterase